VVFEVVDLLRIERATLGAQIDK